MISSLRILLFFLQFSNWLLRTSRADICQVGKSSTANCQHLEQLKLSLNDSSDPCLYLHAYACNNWWSQHGSGHYENVEQLMGHKMNLQLIGLLETLEEEKLKIEFFNKTYEYYRACVEAAGTNAVQGYLDVIKPGENLDWPIFRRGNSQPWPAKDFEMFAFLGRLQDYGFENPLISVQIKELANATIAVVLAEPRRGKELDFFTIETYNLFKNLGLSEDKAFRNARRLTAVNSAWGRTHSNNTSRGMSFGSLGDLESLKDTYPYLHDFLTNTSIFKWNRNIRFELLNLEYFDFLLARQWSAEDKEDLCNLIMVNLLQYLLKDSVAAGHSKLDCIRETRNGFDLVLTFLYYENIYKPKERQMNPDVKAIFQQLRQSLMQVLEGQSEYFDVEKIRIRLNQTWINFGNQPRIQRNSYVRQLYADIPELHGRNYYFNRLQLLRHGMVTSLRRFEYESHVMYFGETGKGYSSTPFYDASRNMLVLPFDMLQTPMYHTDWHGIFKSSSFGFQMAQQIFPQPKQFTADQQIASLAHPDGLCGKLLNTSNAKTASLLRHVGAAAVVYHAYTSKQDGQLQPEFTDMSWQKLFFLNMAQTFCNKFDHPKSLVYYTIVQQIFVQFPNLQEAFQCHKIALTAADRCVLYNGTNVT
uniref:Peptidase M13 N-terminal domain-containing protein n=1 Tax=Musca domestica TaxID=7370 RepID=A0A1I8N7Z4_MUSDO